MVSSLFGALKTWNGSSSALWTTPANWDGGIVPVAGDVPTFPSVATSYSVDITGVGSSPTFDLITVNSSTSPYTFTGGVGDVINFDFNSSLTFLGTMPGTNMGGALSIDNQLIISSANAAGTQISASISETSSPSHINVTGAGLLTLTSGSSTYTGGTNVLAGGKIAITDNLSLGTSASPLTLGNSSSIKFIADMTFTHPTSVAINSTIFTDPATTVNFSGQITGNNLIKDDTGTLILAGTNLYSGGTTVNGGILAINSDASLGASGTPLALNNTTILRTDATVGLSARTITLGAGSETINTNGNNLTIPGQITGSGQLLKDGAGTLLLTGVNNYSGGTRVDAGVLAINGDVNLGMAGTTLLLNAGSTLQANAATTSISAHPITLNVGTPKFFDSNSNTFSISSSITGFSNLTKIGAGTLILTGTNGYVLGTTVDGGTLAINTDASLGTANSPLNLNTGTTLRSDASLALSNRIITLGAGSETIDTNSFNLTIPGQITGSGALTKVGAGTLILTGSNDYLGGTTVNAGILQGNTNSLQGDITDNAAIVFDQSSIISGSYVDVISGSGSVALQGTGTLILANLGNSYTGGTTINGGIFQVVGAIVGPVTVNAGTFDVENSFTITDWTGAPGSFGILGTGATLTFGTSNSTTVASAISGVGGLTKQGSGTVIFSGASTYTGPTQINAGTLVINGSTTSPTTVAAGATLKGTGTIASSLNVFGTLRPGNSVGTINVAGPVTFNAGMTFAVELDPAQASLLNVTAGGVTINPGATLSILPNPGNYTVGSTYTIIQTAGGVVTGTFSTVTNSLPLLVFTELYTPNMVQLRLDKVGSAFSTLFPRGNVGAVAACLDTANPPQGSDLNNIITQLIFAPAKDIKHALNQMQPSQYNAFQLSQENVDTRILSVLSLREAQLHRACRPQEQTWGIWADAFGDILQQDHQRGQYGFHAETGAALIGFDGHATCNLHLGFGGAYTWTNLKWSGHHGNSHISSGYGFAYGTWNVRHFFLDASFVGGCNNYEAKRHISFLNVHRNAKSNHHGYTLAGRLTGGVPFKAWRAEIAPLISLDYDFVHQASFKEHGAKSLNLHVHEKNANLLRAEAGFRVTRRCPPELKIDPCTEQEICVSDARWLPSFQLTVIREWRFQGERYRSRLQDLNCTFTTKGLNPDRTLIAPAVGITYLAGERIELTLDYAGEFDVEGKYWDQKGNFQISYAF